MSAVGPRERQSGKAFRAAQEACPYRRATRAHQKAGGARPCPGALEDPAVRQGIARELRWHIAILEREIAELEASG
jgi:hypothetical protein